VLLIHFRAIELAKEPNALETSDSDPHSMASSGSQQRRLLLSAVIKQSLLYQKIIGTSHRKTLLECQFGLVPFVLIDAEDMG
jgi:hypothetical protein